MICLLIFALKNTLVLLAKHDSGKLRCPATAHIPHIRDQIWPCCKICQDQPRVIICTNYDGPESPVLHTKPQGHWPFDSGEDFWRVFTIYRHGGHLGHVTQTPRTNFSSPIPLRLHMKLGFDRPIGFGEDFWKWLTDDDGPWLYSHKLILILITGM